MRVILLVGVALMACSTPPDRFEGEAGFEVADAVLLVCADRRHLVAVSDTGCPESEEAPPDLCAWATETAGYSVGVPCFFSVGAFGSFGAAVHLESAHAEGMTRDVATGSYTECPSTTEVFLEGALVAQPLGDSEWLTSVDLDDGPISGTVTARHCGDPL